MATSNNTIISNALTQYAADIKSAKEYAAFLLANKDSVLVKVTASLDESLGYALSSNNSRLEPMLIERVVHQTWNNYFNSIQVYQILGAKYYDAIKDYMLSDVKGNNRYSGVKDLTPFTEDNINAFNKKYLTIDENSMLKAVRDFLYYCGSTKAPTAYKKNQMMRNAARSNNAVHSDKAEIIGNLVKAIAYFNGDETPTLLGDTKQKLFQNFIIGQDVELYDGVSICLRPNFNADITLSAKNQELLNSKL